MSKQELSKKVDSITAVQTRLSDEYAKRDLEHRIKIEVKVKADSILAARSMPNKKDSAKKALPAPPMPMIPH